MGKSKPHWYLISGPADAKTYYTFTQYIYDLHINHKIIDRWYSWWDAGKVFVAIYLRGSLQTVLVQKLIYGYQSDWLAGFKRLKYCKQQRTKVQSISSYMSGTGQMTPELWHAKYEDEHPQPIKPQDLLAWI